MRSRTWGRGLRAVVGVVLFVQVFRAWPDAGVEAFVRGILVALGLTGFYLVLHLALVRSSFRPHPWAGAVVALLPVALAYVFGGAPGQVGSLLFIGVSLLVAAARGDGGCEVLSIPGLALGENTRLACLFFSPIDWIEDRLSGERESG